jgi:uncharacterized integral membrane protein
MWILQRLFVVLAIAVVLLFGMMNGEQRVDVRYWFTEASVFHDSPLPLVMVTFFMLGMLFYYLFSIAREWRLRNELRRLRKQGTGKDRELRDLRNITLQEVDDADTGEIAKETAP